jgi:hypothetical protein
MGHGNPRLILVYRLDFRKLWESTWSTVLFAISAPTSTAERKWIPPQMRPSCTSRSRSPGGGEEPVTEPRQAGNREVDLLRLQKPGDDRASTQSAATVASLSPAIPAPRS